MIYGLNSRQEASLRLIFSGLNSNSRIYGQNVKAIKSFIDVGTIPRVCDVRIRRFTSTPEISPFFSANERCSLQLAANSFFSSIL